MIFMNVIILMYVCINIWMGNKYLNVRYAKTTLMHHLLIIKRIKQFYMYVRIHIILYIYVGYNHK